MSRVIAELSSKCSRRAWATAALAMMIVLGTALLDATPANGDNRTFTAGRAGRVYRNFGTNHFSANTTPSLGAVYNGIDFINANVGWAVGFNGYAGGGTTPWYVIKTTNGGSWTAVDTGLTAPSSYFLGYTDVDFINNLDGWVVGEGGHIVATTNGGTSWTQQTSFVGANLYGVQFLTPTNGFVTGDGGVVLKTTNGGSLWSPISVPTNLSLRAVDFVDPNDGWVVGSNAAGTAGVIARTTNGGSSWTLQNFTGTTGFHDVQFTDSLGGWAVGDNGLALKTTNGGTTWTSVSMNTTRPLLGISWRGTQEAYIVGGDFTASSAVIRHTTNAGQTWGAESDDGFAAVMFDVSIQTATSTTVNTGSNVTQSFGGGSTTAGGSSLSFQSITTLGTLASEVVPVSQLIQQAQTDFLNFPGYHLVGTNPSAWQVSFDGQFTGLVTMQFNYDPSLLAGLDPTKVYMLHRDNTTGAITVLPATLIGNNTIQVQSPGFSTFVLAVPEPSSMALAAIGVIAIWAVRRRRNSCRAR